jgi:hypothetical protein
VYEGTWKGIKVAVKCVLIQGGASNGARQRAITEAALCCSIEHSNGRSWWTDKLTLLGSHEPGQQAMQ